MSITIRYFASLREKMGRSEETLDATSARSVREAWQAVSGGQEMPANLLCAVNMEYVSPEQDIHDGDEVAFFPPVTGG